MKKVVSGLALMLALGGSNALAADKDLEKAEALMKQGKAAEAYELLVPMEFERSGNVEYDYLLGIAALDGGKPDKATLAFERVLAVKPNFAGARLDMARAYFAMGDYVRAKDEFETVQTQNPPKLAQDVIKKYLVAIDERQKAMKERVVGYVEGSVGYDDNVSSVTSDFTSGVLSAYNIGNVIPTGNSVKAASGYYSLGGGMELTHAVDDNLSIYGGLDGKTRVYYSASAFNIVTIDGRMGVNWIKDGNWFRAGYQRQTYLQDGAAPGITNDRDSYATSLEWRRMLNESNQVGVFLLTGSQEYKNVPTNDVDQIIFGASWLHLFGGKGNPLIFASFQAGSDRAKSKMANGSDVSKEYFGPRVYGQYSLNDKTDLFANVGHQWRNDKTAFARSTVTDFGKDELMDITVGVNWRHNSGWTIRPQVMYSQNRSNISLYKYDRTEASVTARHDFQ